VSESLKADTLSLFNITKDIRVIPNFIDSSRFKKQKKDHFKTAICPNGEKLLVHTSNFRKVKRVEDVMAVFEGVRKQIPAKLLLVGDGPERARIEQICRDMNASSDVRFLGKLDVVEEVLSVSDLFVMPSEKESFGLAALEAMACEVPLISTNTGGLPELNIQGKTGFLSEVGDVDDMIKNALYILKDENLLEFKKNALSRAKEFEGNVILPQYLDYYEFCLNQQYKMA
jgi:N-acetyl-alpha-D-glucosaminyl L-malate synthase BshA